MTRRLGHVASGEALSAAIENQQRDLVNDLTEARRGISRQLQAATGQGTLFYVIDVGTPILACIAGTATPVGGELVFNIYMPPALAESSRGSVTVTITDVNNATATDGVALETWLMTKTYAVGDSIRATFWDDGRWVDDNIDGRMWASIPVVSGGGG